VLFAHYEADVLAGVIGIEKCGQVGLLRSLVVAKRFQGHGIAKKIVEEAEKYASSVGLRELFLLTTTAGEFFQKQGYSVIDRSKAPPAISATRQFSSLCPSIAKLMYKKLSSN
jgi:amino-acid N-acetyltransferase